MRWRLGLGLRLALLFVAFTGPTLITVDALVLSLERRALDRALDAGVAVLYLDNLALRIAPISTDRAALRVALYDEVQALKQPARIFPREAAYVLTELAADPIVLRYDNAAEAALVVPVVDGARPTQFRYDISAIVPSGGRLSLSIALGGAWQEALKKWLHEWPLLLLISGLMGTLAGVLVSRYISRRIVRITNSAAAWSRGEFVPIADPNRDELSELGAELDRRALELAQLMDARRGAAIRDERDRIARDLHDVVKQRAFALSLNIATVQALLASAPEQADVRLRMAIEQAEALSRDLSDTIFDLREAQGGQWFEALQHQLHDLALSGGLHFAARVSTAEAVLLAKLDPNIADAIALILREGLSNVLRHAHATQVELECAAAPALACRLRDNGRGFSVDAQRAGFGLRNMRDRAGATGLALHIHSDAQGTIVQVSMDTAEDS